MRCKQDNYSNEFIRTLHVELWEFFSYSIEYFPFWHNK